MADTCSINQGSVSFTFSKHFFKIDPPKSINNNIKMSANDVKIIVDPYEVHLIGKYQNCFELWQRNYYISEK